MIKDSYYGAAAFYADDIAVLVVERSFELNKFVLPVCLDRSQQPISVNAIGTTVGWGYTENNKSSNELLEANLPYLDLSSCRRKYSASNFVPFLTSDKFCVLYVNGTGTQVGDSGGGYTQEIQQLHYIYGITSLKSRDTNEFGVFTRIGAHMPWLTSTIDSIEANSELK
ncbi:hypothetical protein AAG570_002979 [Ranatra chinensis]|uniref:Peptidase S1 domain-containing protein n=1 Tax=Ranatra chinensis TaxID=642074 RepID=A0ABD0YHV0_9HEMI